MFDISIYSRKQVEYPVFLCLHRDHFCGRDLWLDVYFCATLIVPSETVIVVGVSGAGAIEDDLKIYRDHGHSVPVSSGQCGVIKLSHAPPLLPDATENAYIDK